MHEIVSIALCDLKLSRIIIIGRSYALQEITYIFFLGMLFEINDRISIERIEAKCIGPQFRGVLIDNRLIKR